MSDFILLFWARRRILLQQINVTTWNTLHHLQEDHYAWQQEGVKITACSLRNTTVTTTVSETFCDNNTT